MPYILITLNAKLLSEFSIKLSMHHYYFFFFLNFKS